MSETSATGFSPVPASPPAPVTPPAKEKPSDTDRLDRLEARTFGAEAVPNHLLFNDEVKTIPITAVDVGANAQALPDGDTFEAVSSDPAALHAGISVADGKPALVVHALKPAGSAIVVTVTDSKGLRAAAERFDIVPREPAKVAAAPGGPVNPAPVALAIDPDVGASVPQPTPV